MDKSDYIIVGSGSAGSIIANRLSEKSNIKISIVEAGGSNTHPFIKMPAGPNDPSRATKLQRHRSLQ